MKKFIKIATIVVSIIFIAILFTFFVLNAYNLNSVLKYFSESESFEKVAYYTDITLFVFMIAADLVLIGLVICFGFFKHSKNVKIACLILAIVALIFIMIQPSMEIYFYMHDRFGSAKPLRILRYSFQIIFCIAAAAVATGYLIYVIKQEKTPEEIEEKKEAEIAKRANKIAKLQEELAQLQQEQQPDDKVNEASGNNIEKA